MSLQNTYYIKCISTQISCCKILYVLHKMYFYSNILLFMSCFCSKPYSCYTESILVHIPPFDLLQNLSSEPLSLILAVLNSAISHISPYYIVTVSTNSCSLFCYIYILNLVSYTMPCLKPKHYSRMPFH